jgi:hypothetical protein
MPNVTVQKARAHLAVVLGERTADDIIKSCLSQSGLEDVRTPDELLRFGERLVARGGFIEVVGRFVRVEAINASTLLSR